MCCLMGLDMAISDYVCDFQHKLRASDLRHIFGIYDVLRSFIIIIFEAYSINSSLVDCGIYGIFTYGKYVLKTQRKNARYRV